MLQYNSGAAPKTQVPVQRFDLKQEILVIRSIFIQESLLQFRLFFHAVIRKLTENRHIYRARVFLLILLSPIQNVQL